eukprot:TRINITY_DN2558_c0_g2_i1.p1 TRINITY_DN2558_c0_g2~~TRINITY_DN2558_c0_g2_i1.p1  ORF type:complete len:594 (+),score=154.73 TRINITY_DN2558_c0_g2_i1:31-1782(+)
MSVQAIIDDLTHEDAVRRAAAMSQLSTIALALGPQRTREEFLPFLAERTDDISDDVLIALAKQIGDFIPYIGGGEFAEVLFPLIPPLLTSDEAEVRNAATSSFVSIIDELTTVLVDNKIINIIDTYSQSKWGVLRCTASQLLPSAYKKASETSKKHLFDILVRLSKDDSPNVKRRVCLTLNEFIPLSVEENREKLIDIIFDMTNCQQDSVRLLLFDNIIALQPLLNAQNMISRVIPIFTTLIQDSCWRVRCLGSEKFVSVLKLIPEAPLESIRMKLLNLFKALLLDREPEVRCSATRNISAICELVPVNEFETVLLDTIVAMIDDKSFDVTSLVAMEIAKLAPMIDAAKYSQLIGAKITNILVHEDAEVRLGFLDHLDEVIKVIDVSIIAKGTMKSLKDLCICPKWRIRDRVAKLFSLLAKCFDQEYFNANILPLLMELLFDRIHTVRMSILDSIDKICQTYSEDWITNVMIMKLFENYSNSYYLYRIVALKALALCSKYLNSTIVETTTLPVILKMASDDVPNVRFAVCNLTVTMIEQGIISKNVVMKQIIPIIQRLQNEDPEKDVIDFAEKALEKIEKYKF